MQAVNKMVYYLIRSLYEQQRRNQQELHEIMMRPIRMKKQKELKRIF
jgi:hypothetical protein